MWDSGGFVVWMTGLPGSGKTTLSTALEAELTRNGLNVEILDGDEVRKNLSPEVGFSREDRERHARRVAYIGKLLSRNGVVTIVSLISPFISTREYSRSIIPAFVEVWIKCSLRVCIERDPKGLYKKATEGEIVNMTGLQDPYEPPLNPELVVNTETGNVKECTDKIISYLFKERYLCNKQNVSSQTFKSMLAAGRS